MDLESPQLEDELDRWQRDPKFCGVRMRFEGDPDPGILARPGIVDGLRKVAGRGIIFEFLVRTPALGACPRGLRSHPRAESDHRAHGKAGHGRRHGASGVGRSR